MSETAAKKTEDAEVVRLKAEHSLARMEHEREMALMDAPTLARMPLSLRLIFDDRLNAKLEAVAEAMASATGFVPDHLASKPNACKVVLIRAIGWNLDPYSVAMATYTTPGGKVAYEGKLYRAIAENSGMLEGPLRHEYYGEWDRLPRPSFKMVQSPKTGKPIPAAAWEEWGEIEVGLGVTVIGRLKNGGEHRLDFDLIDAYPRNASTWPTRPKLQILNAADRAFVNQVAPSLLMGVHFADDPDPDAPPPMRDVTPRPTPRRQQPVAGDEKPVSAWTADGEEVSLYPGEIDVWIDEQIRGASGDELDRFVEVNQGTAIAEQIDRSLARGSPRAAKPAKAQQATADDDGGGDQGKPAPAGGASEGQDEAAAPYEWRGRRFARLGRLIEKEVQQAIDLDLGRAVREMNTALQEHPTVAGMIALAEAEMIEDAEGEAPEEDDSRPGEDVTGNAPAPRYEVRNIFREVVNRLTADALVNHLEESVAAGEKHGSRPTKLLGVHSDVLAAIAADREDLAERCMALSGAKP